MSPKKRPVFLPPVKQEKITGQPKEHPPLEPNASTSKYGAKQPQVIASFVPQGGKKKHSKKGKWLLIICVHCTWDPRVNRQIMHAFVQLPNEMKL